MKNPPGNPEWRDDPPPIDPLDPLTQDVPQLPVVHHPGTPLFGKDRRSLKPAPVRTARIKGRLEREGKDSRPCPWCKGPVDMNMFTDEELKRERARRNGRKGGRARKVKAGVGVGEKGLQVEWLRHKEGFKACRCPGCSESREVMKARELEKKMGRMERRKARISKRLKELEGERLKKVEKARVIMERRAAREVKRTVDSGGGGKGDILPGDS